MVMNGPTEGGNDNGKNEGADSSFSVDSKRRNALQLCGALAGTTIGFPFVSSTGRADPETEDNVTCGSCGDDYPIRYDTNTSYSKDVGRATAKGDLITALFEYEPVTRENYDFWSITLQLKSDTATYYEDYEQGLKNT